MFVQNCHMNAKVNAQKLKSFLEAHGIELVGQIAKGWTSEVFLARDSNGVLLCLKALREGSNRPSMVLAEAENLKLANSIGVGPKLFFFDKDKGVVAMEHIEGMHFSVWLFSGHGPAKSGLEKFISALFAQASALDKIGLDHGQLAGAGKNILVRNGLPVIIDFEKASTQRKCHNLNVIESFLFRSKGSSV